MKQHLVRIGQIDGANEYLSSTLAASRSELSWRFEVQAVFQVQGCEVQDFELRGAGSRVCAVQVSVYGLGG